jgi:lipid II:glycine glycyltransferase (peptidoglycan interpeptide bridge formation enzyme)
MKPTLLVRACEASEYTESLQKLSNIQSPASFLQAPFYGAWQERDGKTVIYYLAYDGDELVAAGLAVKYDAPGGLSFFYSPYGPVVRSWTPDLLAALQTFFKPIAHEHGVSFVRLDSAGVDSVARPVPNHLAVTASLQPRAEWLLDISGDQEAIWMGMHKHARYNIRLAERAGAKFEIFSPKEAPFETFVSLMETTAGRDDFHIQAHGYYQAVLQSIPAKHGFVALCSIDGKPAAVALFAEYDGVMHYVFAGSSNDFRKIAPPYFLIWNAVLEARQRGWRVLNFGGIADAVKGTHLAGVTGFKKRFGGYEVDHLNPVDLVYKPFKYHLLSLYKRLR